MNIGFVCPEYPVQDSANGVSTYTSMMVDALLNRGHRLTVFCLDAESGESCVAPHDEDAVRVRRVRRAGLRLPLLRLAYYQLGYRLAAGYLPYRDLAVGLRRTILEACEEEAIDVLQCPEWAGLPWWLTSVRIPLVVRLHCPISVSYPADGVPPSRSLRAVAGLERRCLSAAIDLTAPSHAMVSRTEDVLGVTLPGTRVIPNPIEVAPTVPDEDRACGSRSILFVGRTDGLKGFDGLVVAFGILARKPEFSDVRLNVVGPDHGVLLDGRNRASGMDYIRATIEDAGIRSRIDMVGRLPYAEVKKLRWPGRIVVVPSRFESFANTAAEGMAAGCAVVASDAGGIPEVVQHERNGLLFRSGDWPGLATQIERLLRDRSLRMRLGAQAQLDVQDRYALDHVAAQTEQFYSEVIERYHARC